MYPQIIKLQSENPTAGQIDMNFKLLSNITLCISLFLFFGVVLGIGPLHCATSPAPFLFYFETGSH